MHFLNGQKQILCVAVQIYRPDLHSQKRACCTVMPCFYDSHQKNAIIMRQEFNYRNNKTERLNGLYFNTIYSYHRVLTSLMNFADYSYSLPPFDLQC